MLEKHQWGSCCYFPDTCHNVQLIGFSGQQGVTLTVQRLTGWGLLRRGEEVGRGGNVPQPPLVFTCSVFMLGSHCTWFHADGSWSLGGSYSSVKSVSWSAVRPRLPYTQSHFCDCPQPCEVQWGALCPLCTAGLAWASGSRDNCMLDQEILHFSTCQGPCGLAGSSQGS